jgi:hypothetical protein
MISDFNILGICETDDITIIKKAFRARAKELHPDVTDDRSKIKNYYLFIEVCNAYDRLVKNSKVNTGITSTEVKTSVNNHEINNHKDPSYVYYKTACKYFELVHPSHWNNNQTITINGKTQEENKLQQKTLDKVKDLVNLFPKAYYYFSIVVHEYPSSVWVNDSKEKMLIIEKRMITYKKIIDSFITWNTINK